VTIQKILLRYEPNKENLLRTIKEINFQFGWFSPEALKMTAKHFSLEESEVYGVAGFYDEINTEEPPFVVVRICNSANCQTKNTEKIIQDLESFFKKKFGEKADKKLRFEKISCMARCLDGPVMKINETVYTKMDSAKAIQIIRDYLGF
jgi:NADH:ubiquinone oxidoreductase subunit E